MSASSFIFKTIFLVRNVDLVRFHILKTIFPFPFFRLSHSSLNNEFFSKALQEWREQLGKGDLTPEAIQKCKTEDDREKAKLDPWKVKHFEPYWGTKKDFDTNTDPLYVPGFEHLIEKPVEEKSNSRKRRTISGSPKASDVDEVDSVPNRGDTAKSETVTSEVESAESPAGGKKKRLEESQTNGEAKTVIEESIQGKRPSPSTMEEATPSPVVSSPAKTPTPPSTTPPAKMPSLPTIPLPNPSAIAAAVAAAAAATPVTSSVTVPPPVTAAPHSFKPPSLPSSSRSTTPEYSNPSSVVSSVTFTREPPSPTHSEGDAASTSGTRVINLPPGTTLQQADEDSSGSSTPDAISRELGLKIPVSEVDPSVLPKTFNKGKSKANVRIERNQNSHFADCNFLFTTSLVVFQR